MSEEPNAAYLRRGRRQTVCAAPVRLEEGWKPTVIEKSADARDRCVGRVDRGAAALPCVEMQFPTTVGRWLRGVWRVVGSGTCGGDRLPFAAMAVVLRACYDVYGRVCSALVASRAAPTSPAVWRGKVHAQFVHQAAQPRLSIPSFPLRLPHDVAVACARIIIHMSLQHS